MKIETDFLIVGSGVAGLFCALNLPKDKKVTIITKDLAEHSDSFLAQGGICVLRDEDDFDSYFNDTMKAGHYENDKESVRVMINSSQDIIKDLVNYGVEFKKENGEFVYTKEGAHSNKRILFHEDVTGKEITSKLLRRVRERDNINIIEYCTMFDIIVKNNKCFGVIVEYADKTIGYITAPYTVLACGGVGGLYSHSTNYRHLTGDALAVALRHNIELKNINYVQIHPTTLYTPNSTERSFLISESVRGEGAVLYNKNKERFVNELLPRDVVTNEIFKQMKKDDTNFVWLSMENINKDEIINHFPNIYKRCLLEGYDVTKECIPVVPAQHYFMGGIKVNLSSKTSMDKLYAIGETSCNGVHGANRLASNSLLESLVFAKRAALDMKNEFNFTQCSEIDEEIIHLNLYSHKKIADEYRDMIIKETKKENYKNERLNNDEIEYRSFNKRSIAGGHF